MQTELRMVFAKCCRQLVYQPYFRNAGSFFPGTVSDDDFR